MECKIHTYISMCIFVCLIIHEVYFMYTTIMIDLLYCGHSQKNICASPMYTALINTKVPYCTFHDIDLSTAFFFFP